MLKILVSDYDDTFYINDTDIKRNIELVNKYNDKFLFVIATGRSYHDYLKKKELYNIKSEYVILNHGATIIKNEEIIYNNEINDKIKIKLIEDLEIDKSINYFGCSKKMSRVNLNTSNLTKINVKYGDIEFTRKKYEELVNKYGDFINIFMVSKNKAIEIVDKKSDKKNAILRLIELENLNDVIVYTIGNGDTDYEMINYFNGYSMVRSSNKIKSLNKKEVDSVSELINMIVLD